MATFSPAFASARERLFGSVRYFCASPEAVRASCMFTRGGGVDVFDVVVVVGDIVFFREFRRSFTCVESVAVPKAFRNCPYELSFEGRLGAVVS